MSQSPFQINELMCDKCTAKIKNHYWGKVKAEAWFFSRDGRTVLCPDHVPPWYPRWRKLEKEKRDGRK